jgi:hypothetical protein
VISLAAFVALGVAAWVVAPLIWPAPAGSRASCPTCGPRPEADARFCSNCGEENAR